MNEEKKTLTVICPVYNESEVIRLFYSKLKEELLSLADEFESKTLFVVDKCTDNTLEILKEISQLDKNVQVLALSNRFGHQMSLVAGMDHAESDIVIMMDSDLQHPINLFNKLIENYKKGYEVVFTIRSEPKDNNILKRLGSNFYYKLLSWLSEVPLSAGQADYRLISKKVLKVFKEEIRERNQFLRGLFSWVGFKSIGVEFKPEKRNYGSSKYNFSRMFRFAFHGITSFSKKPLQYSIYVGILLSIFAFIQIGYVLIQYLYSDSIVSGFSTLAILISLFGGIQLIFLGVIGEYVGSIFDEVKGRPLYIVENKINF